MYGFRTREALEFLRSEDNEVDLPDAQSSDESAVAAHSVIRSAIRNAQNPTVDPQEASVPAVRPPVARSPPKVSKPFAMHEYRLSHIDAKDAIAFAAMRMKAHYDTRHQPRCFNVGDLVNVRLNKGYTISSELKKIGPQLVGPFKVIKRIGHLAYHLDLLDNMRIHPVISVAHLKPAIDPAQDPYHHHRSPPPAVTVEGELEYEIDKLVRKRRIRKRRGWSTQYLIRWKGYGPEHDTWQPERDVMDTIALDEYERMYGTTSGIVHVTAPLRLRPASKSIAPLC